MKTDLQAQGSSLNIIPSPLHGAGNVFNQPRRRVRKSRCRKLTPGRLQDEYIRTHLVNRGHINIQGVKITTITRHVEELKAKYLRKGVVVLGNPTLAIKLALKQIPNSILRREVAKRIMPLI